MGKGGGTTNIERPLSPEEKWLLDAQRKYLGETGVIAEKQDNRSSLNQDIWQDQYLPIETGNSYKYEANPAYLEQEQQRIVQEQAQTLQQRALYATNQYGKGAATQSDGIDRSLSPDEFRRQAATQSDGIDRSLMGGTSPIAQTYYTKSGEKIPEKILVKNGYNANPDQNLKEATFLANRNSEGRASKFATENSLLSSNYGNSIMGMSEKYANSQNEQADRYSQQMGAAAAEYQSNLNAAAEASKNGFDQEARQYEAKAGAIARNFGVADEDMLERSKALGYQGVSSANQDAQQQVEEAMARRGVNGGAYGATMARLAQQSSMNMSQAGAMARHEAIANSDTRRGSQLGVYDRSLQAGLEGARTSATARMQAAEAGGKASLDAVNQDNAMRMQALQNAYAAQNSATSQAFNASQSTKGSNLAIQSAADQQRISNLTGFAQLGRGMASTAQNYLGQAGQTYGQSAQTAGSTANGIGANNNAYNSTMQQAQTAKNGQTAQLIGTGIGAAAMFSDIRLKDNITAIGTIGQFTLYKWEWNDIAKELGVLDQQNFGVLAQEVMEAMPDAVIQMDNGYYKVNYNMIIGA